ncbi:uncharacterized protein LOC105631021 [Jatropha curcas]|uniref:uncharacterized protein LOC105631021 n=1 Tax=Jatropha curcas TaxID=180498 RepID=UPI0009D6527B|nr:uncharacterized protein LOC105631021 [Jatropha curcas]
MAEPVLLRGIKLVRLHHNHHRLAVRILSPFHQSWCSAADATRLDEEVTTADKSTGELSARKPPKYSKWDDPDYRKWIEEENEILTDIGPITYLTKEILHTDRLIAIPDLYNSRCLFVVRTDGG